MPLVESDRLLLERCLKKESGAWEDFVDRFIGLFIHVIQHTAHARSVNLNQDDVEDVCSEIFVTLLKNNFAVLKHFKGTSALGTYLCVVARRIAVKAIVQRRQAEAMGHVHAHRSTIDAVNGQKDPVQRIAEAEDVRRLLSQLPASEAQIVRLFHLEGKTYQEISATLKIPLNSIGPVLTRARQKMRQASQPAS